MSRVQRNRARLALVLAGLYVADRILPFEIFLIAVVVIALVAAAAFSMHWYEQAVDVETENMQLRFAVIGLESEIRDLVQDNDAMLCRLSEALDEHALCPVDEGQGGRDREAVTWGRLAKVSEEQGEVIAAFIGCTGQNPRKGVTHSRTHVIEELLDVAVTALGAVEHMTGNRGLAMSHFEAKVAMVWRRAGLESSEGGVL